MEETSENEPEDFINLVELLLCAIAYCVDQCRVIEGEMSQEEDIQSKKVVLSKPNHEERRK